MIEHHILQVIHLIIVRYVAYYVNYEHVIVDFFYCFFEIKSLAIIMAIKPGANKAHAHLLRALWCSFMRPSDPPSSLAAIVFIMSAPILLRLANGYFPLGRGWNDRIALKFERRFGSNVAETPVKLQNDKFKHKSLNFMRSCGKSTHRILKRCYQFGVESIEKIISQPHAAITVTS